jgi:hypothetical protein
VVVGVDVWEGSEDTSKSNNLIRAAARGGRGGLSTRYRGARAPDLGRGHAVEDGGRVLGCVVEPRE